MERWTWTWRETERQVDAFNLSKRESEGGRGGERNRDGKLLWGKEEKGCFNVFAKTRKPSIVNSIDEAACDDHIL